MSNVDLSMEALRGWGGGEIEIPPPQPTLTDEEETLNDLLIAISEAGLTLRVPAGDHVKLYVSPPDKVTPELAERIKRHRDRIISAMQFDEYRRTEMLQNTRQVLDLWREWERSLTHE